MELTAKNLIKLSPEERDKHYHYPYTGPYLGEPQLYEILHRKEYLEIWGPNHLTIHHPCPACGQQGDYVRNEWAICYNCLIAFDICEEYIDLTEDNEMENLEDE